MTKTEQNIDWVLSSFKLWEKSLNGASKTALHNLRREAVRSFAVRGFPTTREEEWRFTNVAPIAATSFEPVLRYSSEGVTEADIEKFLLGGLPANRMVFINGHFSPQLSNLSALPAGVRIGSLADSLRQDPGFVLSHLNRQARSEEGAFTALNTAFLQDGAFIYLPNGTELEDAVNLLFVATGKATPFLQAPRNLVVAGEGCRLAIVETYHSLGSGSYFTNVVSEISAGSRTVIEHDKLQSEGGRAFHVGTTHVSLGGESNFVSNTISVGGLLVRNNVTAVLDGQGSECTLNGLSVSTGTQLIDNHTTIDHAQPNCTSHELYKAIVDGKSRGVFNGKIYVRKDAQKTDAKQTNKTLLLSDGATIDTKPQLEIFADDVKCTHGATVGQLEEEQVFYLRSRGIPLEAARDILTFAFASDVISRIHVEPLRDQLDGILRARLRQGRVAESA
jgi:Fe-S cluster assembly protein SufD